MKRHKCNKKGSAAVLLSMLFVCLMMVAIILIQASAFAATYAYSDAVLFSAGKSILSEYHLALKDSYGIIAVKGYENTVNAKLEFYTQSAFKRQLPGQASLNNESLTLLKPTLSTINCELKEYSLLNLDVFEEQIQDIMKYNILNLGIEYINKKKKAPKYVDATEVNSGSSEAADSEFGKRKLLNQRIINELPSEGLELNELSIASIVSGSSGSWKQLYQKENACFYVNEYILHYFNNRFTMNQQCTFFKNEAEYILYGKLEDQKNAEAFMRDFKTIHFLLNSAHVYADPKKRQEIVELAALMTPGPEAAITAVVLSETWATAETANDVKLLESGRPVALIKTSDTWALTLKAAINNIGERSLIVPVSNKGTSYEDHVRLFLLFENRETKLLRMMDIIQINIKMNADQSFAIRDCYVGLKYQANINGLEYCYVQTY